MRKIANIILGILIVMLVVWELPWLYNNYAVSFLHGDEIGGQPFTLYSGLADDFIQNTDGSQGRRGVSGKTYTVEEADSLLPFFWTTQLVNAGRLPDTIRGFAVSPQLIRQTNINYHRRAYDTHTNRPNCGLWLLLESMPKRVNLEDPDDAFRFTTEGIEFLNMNTNSLKPKKSKLFTDALVKKGFAFPIHELDGNSDTRKDYDEGYLLIDHNRKMYHMKMTAGQPYVKKIELVDETVVPRFVFVTEFRSRCLRGLMTDENNVLYAITPDYEVKPIGEGIHFDPTQNNMMIMGNMLDWTIRITTAEAEEFYAVSAFDYSLLKSFIAPYGSDPYLPGLHFTETIDRWVKPRFN